MSNRGVTSLEERLIEEFLKNFLEKTGNKAKVIILKSKKVTSLSEEDILNIKKIILTICNGANWNMGALFSKSRKVTFTSKRSMIFSILYNRNYTLKNIGLIFQFDHTSILHSLNTLEDDISTNRVIKRSYQEVENIIENDFYIYKDKSKEEIDAEFSSDILAIINQTKKKKYYEP